MTWYAIFLYSPGDETNRRGFYELEATTEAAAILEVDALLWSLGAAHTATIASIHFLQSPALIEYPANTAKSVRAARVTAEAAATAAAADRAERDRLISIYGVSG